MLEAVAVLADRMQADGDPRGELLALELAAALASEVDEGRRLCREAARLRRRRPDVAWPRALRGEHGLIRGGALVSGTWSPSQSPDLPASLGRTCRSLVVPFERGGLELRTLAAAGLNLDALWEGPNAAYLATQGNTLELDLDRPMSLTRLGVSRPLHNPEHLTRFEGLELLNCGSIVPLEGELLPSLRALELRSLTGTVRSSEQLRAILDACPRLDALWLRHFGGALEPMPGLERLASLTLLGASAGEVDARLPDGPSLSQLSSLFVSGVTHRDLERLGALPRLRRLTLMTPAADADEVIAAIAKLGDLEHLSLLWPRSQASDPAPLAQLSRLRSLTLVGGFRGELDAPANLESVDLRWSAANHVRVRGAIPAIQLDGHFALVEASAELRSARLLSLSRVQRDLESFERALERLDALETLVLDDAQVRPDDVAWLSQHPRLRSLAWPSLTFGQQRAVSQRFPHLQVIGADEPRLRHEWLHTRGFDPLAACNWPKPG